MIDQNQVNVENKTIGKTLKDILEMLICLILFITSIYKGGFYKSDFLFPNVIILILGVTYLLYKMIIEIKSSKSSTRPSAIKTILDIIILVFPIVYFLPVIFGKAVSVSDSIYEGLRYVDFAIIYYIIRKSENTNKFKNVLIALGLLQVIFGIDQLTYRFFEPLLDNISTGYLPERNRLSGTIQYANVTGTILSIATIFSLEKLFCNLSKYDNEEKSKDKIKKFKNTLKSIFKKIFPTSINVFTILVLITSNMLTQSRVSMLLLLLSIVLITILNIIRKNKNAIILTILIVASSFITSSIIEYYIRVEKYNYIYITALVIAIITTAVYSILKLVLKRVKTISKSQKISMFFISLLLLLILISTPTKLKIGVDNIITRNLYEFSNGKNTIEVDVKCKEVDCRYKITFYAVSESFNEIYLDEINYYERPSTSYKKEVNLPEDTIKIKVDVEVSKGEIEIDKLKINSKGQKLSYMFIPDEIMFKLKDTSSGVYGDILRKEYVKDSFKIFKQSPLIGFGGEAFKHKYSEVQEIPYISTEAHSALLQSLTEVGCFGTIIFVAIIALTMFALIRLVIYVIKFDDKESGMYICIVFCVFCIALMLDLVLSYTIGIYIFAILVAMILNEYMKMYLEGNCNKDIKRKEWYIRIENRVLKISNSGYVRIAFLSFSLVLLGFATYLGINAYKASIVQIPNKSGKLSVEDIEENIVYLEIKVEQDRFDMNYRELLNEQYKEYISILKDSYLSGDYTNDERKSIKNVLNKSVIKLKENADNMIDYEYYDKYILKEVADIYIDNFTTFGDIFSKQFKNEETAYAFYLGYVMKLTDRILEIAPKSAKANDMVKEMYTRYVEELKSKNNYLASEQIQIKIEEMQKKLSKINY